MQKTRLDVLMVEKGLAESRSLAQRLVMAGQVRVNGQVELKPATRVDSQSQVNLELGPRFVSRGGEKLEGALKAFEVDVHDCVCADIGASTGGFTDCLLQHGALRVYAIDVGYGILHWKLRNDKRVVVMERTNARYVEVLPEEIAVVTVDASFISLKLFSAGHSRVVGSIGWTGGGFDQTSIRGWESRGQPGFGSHSGPGHPSSGAGRRAYKHPKSGVCNFGSRPFAFEGSQRQF